MRTNVSRASFLQTVHKTWSCSSLLWDLWMFFALFFLHMNSGCLLCQMLSRLLNSSHPEDLKAANKLIKEMVQEVKLSPSHPSFFDEISLFCYTLTAPPFFSAADLALCVRVIPKKKVKYHSAALIAGALTEWENGLVALGCFVCHWQSDSAGIQSKFVLNFTACWSCTLLLSQIAQWPLSDLTVHTHSFLQLSFSVSESVSAACFKYEQLIELLLFVVTLVTWPIFDSLCCLL